MTDNNPSNPIVEDKATVEEALPEAEKGQRSGEDDNNLSLEIEALRAENQKLKEEIRMILFVYGPTNEGIYEPEQSTAERSMEDGQTKKKSKNIFKRWKNIFKRWRQQHKERHQQRKELETRYPQLGKQRKKDETNEAVIEAIIDTVTAVANG